MATCRSTKCSANSFRERSRQHPQIAFDFAADALARSYGDSIDLTVYRCIQESLTNVIRHAEAKHVAVDIRHDNAAGLLELTVRDDGHGMPAGAPTGFGIRGMRERVEVLGGDHRVASKPGQGACVTVVIPFGSAAPVAARRTRVAVRSVRMTRVLIVDDHPIVLQGCRRMLQDAGINDVFEARDPATGYRLYCRHVPKSSSSISPCRTKASAVWS